MKHAGSSLWWKVFFSASRVASLPTHFNDRRCRFPLNHVQLLNVQMAGNPDIRRQVMRIAMPRFRGWPASMGLALSGVVNDTAAVGLP